MPQEIIYLYITLIYIIPPIDSYQYAHVPEPVERLP